MSTYSNRLYKLKCMLFKLFPAIQAVWAFNRNSRDLWIQQNVRELPRNLSVIDIGAGSCPYKYLFNHCNYIAQDFGKLEDNQIQERMGYGNIDIYSEITAIPVENNSFDVVLCTEVIEHVPEPIKAVKEMGRILKPGGLLMLTAPLRSALHQMPFHYYGGFTPTWYYKFLDEAGFENISIIPVSSIFNFYGEESLRITLALSPFSPKTNISRLLLFPVWIITLPWFAFFCPLFCYLFDKLGIEMGATVGYRVTARRKSDISRGDYI